MINQLVFNHIKEKDIGKRGVLRYVFRGKKPNPPEQCRNYETPIVQEHQYRYQINEHMSGIKGKNPEST